MRYIQRIETDGTDLGNDLWSLQVSYYRKPGYDRLYSIGPSLQKQSKEAKRAAAGEFTSEIDAPCCHFRILLLKLKQLDMYTTYEWPMLTNSTSIIQCGANSYQRTQVIAAEDAKLSLIKIGHGAPAQCDLPMIRKLCAEVHAAATALVNHSSTVRFSSRYSDRPNPTFSCLSAINGSRSPKCWTVCDNIQ